MISVAVFAHNESKNILRCLSSLEMNALDISVYVLINGSTDNTEEIVHSLSKTRHWIKPVNIPMGDKSNAWNVFIHDTVQASDAYIFLDGDCYIHPGSIEKLVDALNSSDNTLASAAFPGIGRSKELLSKMLNQSAIVGCLYALSKETVQIIWDRNIRLPIGCIGDDSVLDYLLATNFEGGYKDIARHKIIPAPEALFYFDPMSPMRLDDYIKYYKRCIRYSTRHFQCQMLIPLLKKHGLSAMPDRIDALLSPEVLRKLKPRHGLDAIFDRIALSKLQHALRNESITPAT